VPSAGQLWRRRTSYFNIRTNFISLNPTGFPYAGERQLAKR
jgi:hypothetical protein